MVVEVAIIGGGPAGLAAGMQLTRQRIPCLVFEGASLGGLLNNANLVENYPGFPRGVRGPKLVQLMTRQAQKLGVPVCYERVQALKYQAGQYTLETEGGSYQAHFLVLATGTRPRLLTDPLVPAELQDRLFYEVYPLRDLRAAQVAIIGAGDAAFDYALNLAQHNQVLILNRGDQARALGLLQERVAAHPAVSYKVQTRVLAVAPGIDDSGLILTCQTPAGTSTIRCDMLVAAVGREPDTALVSAELQPHIPELVSAGQLYRIGDLVSGRYRQTAIAAGQGIEAAMRIQEQIHNTGAEQGTAERMVGN